MPNITVQTRMPKEMKERAQRILSKMGLDFSTANRLFYSRIIQEKGIPFPLCVSTQWSDLNEKEERKFSQQAAQNDLKKIWDDSAEDVWDDFYKDTPSLR